MKMHFGSRKALFGLALASAIVALPAGATDVTLKAPGADKELLGILRGASVAYSLSKSKTTTPQDLLAGARADYARILSALYEQGHYSGVISIRSDGREVADIPTFFEPKSIGTVTINIQPGPEFRFSRAELGPLPEGAVKPSYYATGNLARSTRLTAAARDGVDAWRGVGFAKASVAGQKIIADHATAQLAADIRLAPGPRVQFGELHIEGNSRVRTTRIREIAGFPTGEQFDPVELERAAKRLRRTGTFRSVALSEAENLGPGQTLDITAALVDAKPRRVGFGAEISSLEGLELSAFWLHRNLLGGAERLRFDAKMSGIGGNSGGTDYLFAANFTRPATFTPDTSLYIVAELKELDEPEFFERAASLGAGVSHIFSDTLTGKAGIEFTALKVRDDLGARRLRQFRLPVALTWDKRDDKLNPTKGMYVDLGVTPFVGIAGSASGARVYTDTRAYRALDDEGRFVLAGRAQVGSVFGASAAGVAPDMLFFSGGGGTVRGQPYQSLAVDLGGGLEIGGRSFVGLSGEIRAGLNKKLQLVGFVDTGFIGAGWIPGEDGEWHSGAGIGLRYKTGIGPIRFDVAAPLGGRTSGGIQFYVGIGQAF